MRSTSRSRTTRSDPSPGGRGPAQAPIRTAAAVLLAACLAGAPDVVADPVTPHFTDVSEEAGLDFEHSFGGKRLESVLMTTGGGCALFDYDGDDRLDAFLVNGTWLDDNGRPRPDKATRHALFHNEGGGRFRNLTAEAGLAEASYGQGCACADYDGDGFTDLYITNYGPNRLYHNRGDGTFEDVTNHSGTGSSRWSTGAIFFDYDGDGDLDLYVANYLVYKPGEKGPHASALSKRLVFRFFPGPRDFDGANDVLYRNEGNGTFTDVSREVGLEAGGKGLGVLACDFDEDGDQDVFVANDTTPNFLYRNDDGRFTEIAIVSGVAFDPDGVETAGMGVDVSDVDGDGDQDLYVTNMVFEFNNLYRNLGGLVFDDFTKGLGLDKDNYRHVGWAIRFADFNQDGRLDCFVANGHVIDYVEGLSQSVTYPQRNMLFVGDARGRFENVASKSGDCLRRKRVSRGAAFGDIDDDGDLDILVANSGQRAELLRNDSPANDRWLQIRLAGNPPNTAGIGAKVEVRFGGRIVRTESRFASTYLSSSDPTIHVGLAPGETDGVVEVTWPSGERSVLEVRAGTRVVVEEREAAG